MWRRGREGFYGGARAWEASEGGRCKLLGVECCEELNVSSERKTERERERKKERRKKGEGREDLRSTGERDLVTSHSGKEEWMI